MIVEPGHEESCCTYERVQPQSQYVRGHVLRMHKIGTYGLDIILWFLAAAVNISFLNRLAMLVDWSKSTITRAKSTRANPEMLTENYQLSGREIARIIKRPERNKEMESNSCIRSETAGNQWAAAARSSKPHAG